MILLLFFLVLLLLVFSYIRNAELDRSRAEAQAKALAAEKSTADLKERVERLQLFYDRIVAQLPDAQRPAVADTLVALDKLRAELANLNDKKSELEKEILAQEELIARLAKKVPVAQVPDDIRKEIGDLAFCKKASAELPKAQQKVVELEMDNKNMRGIAKEATAKASRCGGKGEEYVACWRDPDTSKIQYVYEVTVDGTMVRVERKWPQTRDPEMARFAAERELVGRTVTVGEFLRGTEAIFAQSVRDTCRHFVVISGDQTKMNSAMFAQFIRIQDHFYKQSNIR